MSRKKVYTGGLVYSTNADSLQEEHSPVQETLAPNKQLLRISLDTKQRAGKAVTLIEGFIGLPEDLEQLGKLLKNSCGSGGAVKDGYILIQGDHREKVRIYLTQKGYRVKG